MNKSGSKVIIAAQLLQVTSKETCFLQRTVARLHALNIDIAWVKSLDENIEMLDAFVARYSRLQGTLGDKLLPVLLRASLEKTGAQIDNLLRAEKLGWIDSTELWIEIRELRNRLVHEYMETADVLLEALQQALRGVPVLIDTQLRMADYVQQLVLKKVSIIGNNFTGMQSMFAKEKADYPR